MLGLAADIVDQASISVGGGGILVQGYDPIYGARPLKRVIQKSIQDPLAELIPAGRVKDGEKVTISAGKQGLAFNGKLAAAA